MTRSALGALDLASLFKARTGLQLAERVHDAEPLFVRSAQASGDDDLAHLMLHMSAADPRFQRLIDEVAVRETYFFRHPEHFSLLSNALRELRARKAGRVRLWSAGCASGEEPYSIAMQLDQEGLLGAAAIFGSDLCASALAAARRGRYREWSLRALSPDLIERYFTRAGTEFVLSPALRRAVEYFPLNLAEESYPSIASGVWGFDVIMCRNVLIYFDGDMIRSVANRLFETLAPGGWLFTGPSDPVLSGLAPFEVTVSEHGLSYRRPSTTAGVMSLRDAVASNAPSPRENAVRAVSPIPRALDGVAIAAERTPSRAQGARAAEAAAAAMAVRAAFKTRGPLLGARACEAALAQHPLCAELHYLRALSRLEAGCLRDAEQALKRCLYIDRSLTLAHFTLGLLRTRMGDASGARQSFQNALACCRDRPALEALPLGEGATVSEIGHATTRALANLVEPAR